MSLCIGVSPQVRMIAQEDQRGHDPVEGPEVVDRNNGEDRRSVSAGFR